MKKKEWTKNKLVLLSLGVVMVPTVVILGFLFLGGSESLVDEDSRGVEVQEVMTSESITSISNDEYEPELELGFSDVQNSFEESSSLLVKKSPTEIVEKFEELLGEESWTLISTTFQCNPEFDGDEYLSSQVFTSYTCSNSEEFEVPTGSNCSVVWNENYRFVESVSVELVTDSWEENSRTLRELIVFVTEDKTLGEWVSSGQITPTNVLQEALNEKIETEEGYWQVTLNKVNDAENRSESVFTMEFVPTMEWVMGQDYWVSYADVSVETQENFLERNREVFDEARDTANSFNSSSSVDKALDRIVENYGVLVEALRESGELFSSSACSSIATSDFDESTVVKVNATLPIGESFVSVSYSYDKSLDIVSVSVESYGELEESLENWLSTLGEAEVQSDENVCFITGQF